MLLSLLMLLPSRVGRRGGLGLQKPSTPRIKRNVEGTSCGGGIALSDGF